MAVHLVLGGARSGKSRFAERLALDHPGTLHYIATAQSMDEEMAERIRHHQNQRSPRFITNECPKNLAQQLQQLDKPDHFLLVDCLTLWLSNWIEMPESDWQEQRRALLDQLRHSRSDVVLVSNEVGQGIVPLGSMTRRFVDEAGRLHQDIAALADRVSWVVAGLPQTLK